MRLMLAAGIGILTPALAVAQPASGRPIVVELFTSEGCSSCPPADAEAAALARDRADLLVLTFHVTYWNNLGWPDPFSLEAATQRQRRYVALGISPEVYTPALIVDGKLDAIGSDPAAVDAALRRAAAAPETAARVDIRREDAGLRITVDAGTGSGRLLLVGFDRMHRTHVVRGENGGRTLDEANIVRSLTDLGSWSGGPVAMHVSLPIGQDTAVLLQRDDGRMIGAAASPGKF